MVSNGFDCGPEGWCSYDYHWSIVAKGCNIFILTTWQASGGVNDSGYIWCDETRWSADTPESPVSLLPFLIYNNWMGRGPMDMREAEVSVFLRGDSLELHGSECYFWVLGAGARWHCNSHPLAIGDGHWAADANRLSLKNDEALWYLSWSSDATDPPSFDTVLANVVSYGISLVGFGQEPRGKFSMDEFAIQLRDE